MRKFFILILLLVFLYLPSAVLLQAASNASLVSLTLMPKCSPELQRYMNAIIKVPEARALINAIQKEGPFQILVKNMPLAKQFGALWDPEKRTIFIDPSSRNVGSVTGTLLFELHNASVNGEIKQLNLLARKGRVDKNTYVKAMEFLEYTNALNASKLAQKGIKLKVLSKDACLSTFSTFEEYLKAQKKCGHSACIAQNYELCRGSNRMLKR